MKKISNQKERIRYLKYIESIMRKNDPVYLPSNYWKVVGEKAKTQFIKDGFNKFKIREGLDYFQFLIYEWNYWQFQYVWKKSNLLTKIRAIVPAIISPKFNNFPMVRRQKWVFMYYHFLLWDYVKKQDKKNLLELYEPLFGSPLLVKWRNHTFTQDLLNSILETYSVLRALAYAKTTPRVILEVGGGYGRNMYVLKKTYPNSKIIMVDIPPAIILAQWYMSKVFPGSQILPIGDYKSFEEIKEKYNNADFVFLLPHQINLIPHKSINLFININSFQEMSFEQIRMYFKYVNKLTKGIFYSKQWKKQDNPDADVQISENEYPINKSWKKIFHRESQVQSKFFEEAYFVK